MVLLQQTLPSIGEACEETAKDAAATKSLKHHPNYLNGNHRNNDGSGVAPNAKYPNQNSFEKKLVVYNGFHEDNSCLNGATTERLKNFPLEATTTKSDRRPESHKTTIIFRVKYVNDNDPFNQNGATSTNNPTQDKQPQDQVSEHQGDPNKKNVGGDSSQFIKYNLFTQIPLITQIPCLIKTLGAPHKPEDCALQIVFPKKKIPSRHMKNGVSLNGTLSNGNADDSCSSGSSDDENGPLLDLDVSLNEQIRDILPSYLKSSDLDSEYEFQSAFLILRTKITIRVHKIIETILNSNGRQLRRSLFGLKQLFQDDKDLVHEFIRHDGLACLVKVGMESDQNYQNYILRALSQIMLYVDGMDGIKKHNETLQWLYSLFSSKYRLVIKTALKLMLVFLEYRDDHSYHVLKAIYIVEADRPFKNLVELFSDSRISSFNDPEIHLHSVTIVNRILSQLTPNKVDQQNVRSKVANSYNKSGSNKILTCTLSELIRLLDNQNFSDKIINYKDNLNHLVTKGGSQLTPHNIKEFQEQLNRYINLTKLSGLTNLLDIHNPSHGLATNKTYNQQTPHHPFYNSNLDLSFLEHGSTDSKSTEPNGTHKLERKSSLRLSNNNKNHNNNEDRNDSNKTRPAPDYENSSTKNINCNGLQPNSDVKSSLKKISSESNILDKSDKSEYGLQNGFDNLSKISSNGRSDLHSDYDTEHREDSNSLIQSFNSSFHSSTLSNSLLSSYNSCTDNNLSDFSPQTKCHNNQTEPLRRDFKPDSNFSTSAAVVVGTVKMPVTTPSIFTYQSTTPFFRNYALNKSSAGMSHRNPPRFPSRDTSDESVNGSSSSSRFGGGGGSSYRNNPNDRARNNSYSFGQTPTPTPTPPSPSPLFSWRDKFKKSDLVTIKKISPVLPKREPMPPVHVAGQSFTPADKYLEARDDKNTASTSSQNEYNKSKLQIPVANNKASNSGTPSSARTKFQYLDSISRIDAHTTCAVSNILTTSQNPKRGLNNSYVVSCDQNRPMLKMASRFAQGTIQSNLPPVKTHTPQYVSSNLFCSSSQNVQSTKCLSSNSAAFNALPTQHNASSGLESKSAVMANKYVSRSASRSQMFDNLYKPTRQTSAILDKQMKMDASLNNNQQGCLSTHLQNTLISTPYQRSQTDNTVPLAKSAFDQVSFTSSYQPHSLINNSMSQPSIDPILSGMALNSIPKLVETIQTTLASKSSLPSFMNTTQNRFDQHPPQQLQPQQQHQLQPQQLQPQQLQPQQLQPQQQYSYQSIPKYESESQQEWNRILKNLTRPLVIGDLDFTDLSRTDDYTDNQEDDTNCGYMSNSDNANIPTPPPPPPIPIKFGGDSRGTPPRAPPAPPFLIAGSNSIGRVNREGSSNNQLDTDSYLTCLPRSKNLSASTMCLSSVPGTGSNGSLASRKTLRLFWRELRIPITIGSMHSYKYGKSNYDACIWDSLTPMRLDEKKLEYLFETRAKELVPKDNKTEKQRGQIIVLDSKRSNAINIGMTKLPPARAIKAAILKMDNSIMNRENIEKLLTTMIPTEEEKQKILDAQMAHPQLPLGTAEQFLVTLSTISEIRARLKLWSFKLDYDGMERDIAEPLMDLKIGLEEIWANKTLKNTLNVILSIGNFLNGTQCKGFHFDYLSKLPEIKDTVQKQTLLHHVCEIVMERYSDSTDLYSEIGSLVRSSRVDFEDLTNNLDKMELLCKENWDNLRAVIKYENGPVLKIRMSEFINDCAQRVMVLKIVHRRLHNRYRNSLRYFGIEYAGGTFDVKMTQFCRIFTDFALEYKTCRERVLENAKKKQKNKERSMTRGKMIIDTIKRNIPFGTSHSNINSNLSIEQDYSNASFQNVSSSDQKKLSVQPLSPKNSSVSLSSKFSFRNFIGNSGSSSTASHIPNEPSKRQPTAQQSILQTSSSHKQLYSHPKSPLMSADRALQNVLLSPTPQTTILKKSEPFFLAASKNNKPNYVPYNNVFKAANTSSNNSRRSDNDDHQNSKVIYTDDELLEATLLGSKKSKTLSKPVQNYATKNTTTNANNKQTNVCNEFAISRDQKTRRSLGFPIG